MSTSTLLRRALWGGLGLTIALLLPLVSVDLARAQRPAADPALARLQLGLDAYTDARYREALTQWEAIARDPDADCPTRARALRFQSLAHQHLGRWDRAEQTLTESARLAANCTSEGDPLHAQILNTRGRLAWARGDSNTAAQTWERAAAAYLDLGNVAGMQRSKLNQARALQSLGLSREAERVLADVSASLEAQPDPDLKTASLLQLGSARRRLGKLDRSERELERALALAPPAQRSRVWLELGNTQRAMLERALARGDRATARDLHARARHSYREAARVATRDSDRATADLAHFALLARTGVPAPSEAEPSSLSPAEFAAILAAADAATAALPPGRTGIYARLNYARSLSCLLPDDACDRPFADPPAGNQPTPADVAAQVTTALDAARALDDIPAESYALGQLGELYERTGQLEAAAALTRDALIRLEGLDAPDLRYRWEWQFARLETAAGNPDSALAAYRTTVKTLQSVRADLLAANPEVQFSFRDDVEPVYRGLVDLLLRPDRHPSQDDLRQAIAAIDALRLAELENYLGCQLDARTSGFDRLDGRVAPVYPIVLDDRLDVIYQLPGSPELQLHSTPVARRDVEDTLEALRQSLLTFGATRLHDLAGTVYQWILAPFEEELRASGTETLVFVLDGYLRNIPVGVLYDESEERYLVEKPYASAVLPSARLFDLDSERAPLRVLAAGIREPVAVEGLQFAPLDTEAELKQVQARSEQSLTLFDRQFTLPQLRARLSSGEYSVVHLATHGNFSSDPEQTYLLTFAETAGAGPSDSATADAAAASPAASGALLRPRELDILLRDRAAPLDLLVLSACQTATGDRRAPLGLAGLAVRSGARSTLATLWQVSDRSTVELMSVFYRELGNPEVSTAGALHRAQQTLLARPEFQNPYYWAPYVLVGNWR